MAIDPNAIFNKINLKVKPHLCSWTNYAVLVSGQRIAFVFIILHEIPKNVNSFLRFFLTPLFRPRCRDIFRHTRRLTESALFPESLCESEVSGIPPEIYAYTKLPSLLAGIPCVPDHTCPDITRTIRQVCTRAGLHKQRSCRPHHAPICRGGAYPTYNRLC